jgi:hypothetical protein
MEKRNQTLTKLLQVEEIKRKQDLSTCQRRKMIFGRFGGEEERRTMERVERRRRKVFTKLRERK